MGGVGEGYAAPHCHAYGCLTPVSGNLSPQQSGLARTQRLRLILPRCTDIQPGDGIGLQEETAVYRCIACERYPLHLIAVIERRIG